MNLALTVLFVPNSMARANWRQRCRTSLDRMRWFRVQGLGLRVYGLGEIRRKTSSKVVRVERKTTVVDCRYLEVVVV